MCSRTTKRVERAVDVMTGAGWAVAAGPDRLLEQAATAAAPVERRKGSQRLIGTMLIIVFNSRCQATCYQS
jgi:hypothetical protein